MYGHIDNNRVREEFIEFFEWPIKLLSFFFQTHKFSDQICNIHKTYFILIEACVEVAAILGISVYSSFEFELIYSVGCHVIQAVFNSFGFFFFSSVSFNIYLLFPNIGCYWHVK